MKKLLILLVGCLILGTVAAEAQMDNVRIIDPINPKKVKKTRSEYGFEQSVDLSFKVGQAEADEIYHLSKYFDPKVSVMANWTGGYRFNKTFFLGGGAGFGVVKGDRIHNYRNPRDSKYDLPDGHIGTIQANLYAQMRAYIPINDKWQPFVALSIGSAFCDDDYLPYGSNEIRLLINPEAGINYRIKEHLSFYFNIGYVKDHYSALQLKLGVTF